MDKSQNTSNGGATDASRFSHPPLSRESSTTMTPRTDSWPSKLASQSSHTSAQSSAAPSPLPSREPSPSRPARHNNASRASSTGPSARSRKNSQQDPSPTRSTKSSIPTPATGLKMLSATTTPILLPAPADSLANAPVPQKPSGTTDMLRDTRRWPVSPRLRSPPPILHKPVLPPPRKGEHETPVINVQRSTPSPQRANPDLICDLDPDDSHLQSGMRTPARGSTLETVQEASPLTSPKQQDLDDALEKLEDSSIISDISTSQPEKANSPANESGSETGSTKMEMRSGATAAAPPPLTTRQSTASIKHTISKSKTEVPLQSMTVETETVTSIPQLAQLAHEQGAGPQGTNGSLRTKPSSETIRPKKEKKKTMRKSPAVSSGTGEPPNLKFNNVFQPRLWHHHQLTRPPSRSTDARISHTRPCGLYDGAISPRSAHSPNALSQSLMLYHMNTLLTRPRPVSSKADIFEAKVASAVEEANSSDSEETFVYDSNPPDGRDRPHHRFHSRTPSATSMISQIDRNGMRSIPGVLENVGLGVGVTKKNMKFVNVNALNPNGTDIALGDDDGRGTGRSNAGSGRGTARHHHHFGRWGRNSGGSHRSIFADESPFHNSASPRSLLVATNSRQSSGPPSPRYNSGRGADSASRRGTPMMAGYDLDDTTTGADDERTPLIHSTMRSSRSGRSRRTPLTARPLEHRGYRQPPSFLNRFASCLVLTVMLVLVISGAIGFMFATSQPLTEIELIGMKNVLASEQELMLDITVKAKNPNVAVVVIDSADIEVFAKSPHAGTDSEWWRRPHDSGTFSARRKRDRDVHAQDDPPDDPPPDNNAPNMRLGTIRRFDSPLSFEGSFFHQGISSSTGEVRLHRPGNTTDGGSERWERILEDEFDLILKGVLKYSLPLSQRVRSVAISGRTHVKPNSANDPTPNPNGTDFSIHF